ncbi:MAG: hypothetical protein GY716_21740 [bacterium]|nr:hypothetical protein [bacterium]
MAATRVFTSIGLVSALGDTSADLFDRLLDGRVPEGRLPEDDGAEFPHIAIEGFKPRDYVKRKGLKHVSRASQLACAAASRIAGGLETLPAERVGVVFGSAWASLDSIVRFEREAHVEGLRFVDPILFTETVANVPAGQVSIFFNWSAVNATVSAGTASGIEAIRRAIEFLDEQRADVVVAGGGDELNRHLLRTLRAEGQSAAELPCAPLSEGAAGAVGSEGACLLTVESESHARSRGAEVLGRIRAVAGRTVSADRSPAEAGTEMLRGLLDDAGLAAADVDLLVLSMNGSHGRDALELEVLRRVFGDSVPATVAPKAVSGETWAASAPLGVALAYEAMRRGCVPRRPDWMEHAARAWPGFVDRTVQRDVRNAVIVDCSDNGHLAALALGSAQ